MRGVRILRYGFLIKIIFIVLIVGLLIFRLYPEKNSIPAAGAVYSELSTSATSKAQIQVDENAGVQAVASENVAAAATQFNTQALFETARELRLCKSVPKSAAELSLWLDNANRVGEPNELIEDVIARYEQCLKHAGEAQNYVVLLLKAAEQGSDEAVSELWAMGDAEYFDSLGFKHLNRDQLIAERLAFTQKKYDLAHIAALLGGEQSLERLITGYRHFDPVTHGQSYYKSVAYADFAMSTTRNNDFHRKVDWIKQRLLNSMSNDEVEQAQSLTEKLLAEAMNSRN